MITKRIIPVFLLKGKRLVKGKRFSDFVDVGDPLSQAMIYDAQGADEIVIVDVEASRNKDIIDAKIISRMINNCRLPIGAGGGIKSLKDALECFKAGVDKIIVNTYAVLRPILVRDLAREFGSQSVIVSLDLKKLKNGKYGVYIFSGKEKIDLDFETLLQKFIDYGAGEIILTSINREGTLSGFDCELYKKVRNIVSVPLIASGGAGSYDDIVELFKETGCDASAIGKMLFLRDYDIVRIKSYLKGKKIPVRDA